jgi:hypothetical protein
MSRPNNAGRRLAQFRLLLLVDGAGNHGSDQLVLPANIIFLGINAL